MEWLWTRSGDDLFSQDVEYRRIAKEAGDVDQQVRGEAVELFFIAPQDIEIPLDVVGLDRRHRHAALDPAPQRALLVEPEIMGCFFPEEIDDLGQPVRSGALFVGSGSRTRERHSAVELEERVWNAGQRKDKIDRAGQDRTSRHPIESSLVWVLRDDEAALFLDGLQRRGCRRRLSPRGSRRWRAPHIPPPVSAAKSRRASGRRDALQAVRGVGRHCRPRDNCPAE